MLVRVVVIKVIVPDKLSINCVIDSLNPCPSGLKSVTITEFEKLWVFKKPIFLVFPFGKSRKIFRPSLNNLPPEF